MSRRLLPLLVVALLCLGAEPAAAACSGATTAPTASNLAGVRSATLCLLNERRGQAGLPALASDRQLEDTATRFSRRMVAERFFSHVAPDGSTLGARVRASGYLNGLNSWAIGENIAYGSGSFANAAKIVQMWMESPGHRANILSGRFRAIGVGIVTGTPRGSEGATYTTNFGSTVRSGAPAGAAAQAPPPPAASHRKVKKKKRKAARLTRRSCRRVLRSRRAKRSQKRRCARYLRRQRAHRRKR
jgi:uncharacterized protein YkwD